MERSDRLTFLFDSPIDTGILLATLLMWIRPGGVSLQSSGVSRVPGIGIWIGHLSLLFLLSWTGSRGPILAYVCSQLAVSGLSFARLHRVSLKLLALRFSISVVALACFLAVFGVGNRFHGVGSEADASSLNRVEIYRHSWDLLAMKPLSGVGPNWGAYHYSQWLEPARLDYEYTTLLNVFLEVGVERGLVALAALLIVLFAALLYPVVTEVNSFGRWRHYLLFSSWSSLLTLSLCGLTSSYLKSPVIVGTFVVCVLVNGLVCRGYGYRSWLASLALVLLLATGVGIAVNREAPRYSVTLDSRHVVSLNDEASEANRTTLALVDEEVLGRPYGGVLRAFLGYEVGKSRVLVPLPEFEHRWSDFHELDTVVSFGSSASILEEWPLQGVSEVCFVDPDGIPPQIELSGVKTRLIRPTVWTSPFAREWERFIADRGGKVIVGNIGKSRDGCSLSDVFSEWEGRER